MIKRASFRLLYFCFIGFSSALAQQQAIYQTYVKDPSGLPANHPVDMQHLRLEVAFDPAAGIVAGEAMYTFEALQMVVDTLFLHAPGISVNQVLLDGKQVRFRTDDKGLTIYLHPVIQWGDPHQLYISYTARPVAGIYFIGWNENTDGLGNDPDRIRKQIWTQGQGTDNRYWIPSYDEVNDKLITELIITFDKQYAVISNGNLKEVTNNGDGRTKTWHYAMQYPHSNYLIMLAIGDYTYQDYVSKNGIVSRQYFYPDKAAAVEETYLYSAEMMDWMAAEIGLPYPWSTYANVPVQEFLYGAMENTTATIFSDAFYQEKSADRSYVGVNAHELAHQWFGDYVTAWGGRDHWLQESFATHYSKKFREFAFGEDEFYWIKRQEMLNAINADNRDDFPLAHSQAGSARHYPKGSFVLDMMRYVLGNEPYRKVIQDYLEAHPYDHVRSEDLEIQCMRSLGVNMFWFFDQWVYRAGYPVYEVSTQKEDKLTVITVKQVQDSTTTMGLFDMPVVVQVHYTDGGFDEVTYRVWERESSIAVPNSMNKEIAFVLFDPGTQILSQVKFEKDYNSLRYQAYNAPLMLDRYDAIMAMESIPMDQKRDDLVDLYQKESFYAIKQEIISQLANDPSKKSIAVLTAALQDDIAGTRKAVLQNLTSLPVKLEKPVIALLNNPDYPTVETALRFLMKHSPEKKAQWLDLTANQYGVNKNIRIAWLEYQWDSGNPELQDELIAYTSALFEFRTRNNAMQVFRRLNICTPMLADNLIDAYLSYNRRLSNPAKGLLVYLRNQSGFESMIDNAIERAINQGADEKKLAEIRNP